MEYLKELEARFGALAEELREELLTLRTNRPTPKLIENVKVEYGDNILSVKQLGSIGIELPRSLIVSVWDVSITPQVAKAIETANLGVGVSSEGNVVRINLPELTEERRAELIKLVKASTERIRIKMRTSRDEVNKRANAEADKDVKFRAKEELQKIVDNFNHEIDRLVENKVNEIQT